MNKNNFKNLINVIKVKGQLARKSSMENSFVFLVVLFFLKLTLQQLDRYKQVLPPPWELYYDINCNYIE